MTRTAFALAVAAGFMMTVLIAGAGDGRESRGRITTQPTSRATKTQQPSTREILSLRVKEIDFDQVPLIDVCDWLRKASGANVYVSWKRLEANGVDRDTPITLKAKDMTIRRLLGLITEEAAGIDVRLAYRISDDLIMVSTAEHLGNQLITKTYEVSSLIMAPEGHTSILVGRVDDDISEYRPHVARGTGVVQPIINRSTSGSLLRIPGNWRPPRGQDPALASQRLLAKLVEVITDSVEPDSWAVHGGHGTIHAFNSTLVIRNTPLVHQQIGGPLYETNAR